MRPEVTRYGMITVVTLCVSNKSTWDFPVKKDEDGHNSGPSPPIII